MAGKSNITTDQYIERFKSVHGDRYDYSKTVYKNQLTDLEIICKKHGPFKQNPKSHYRGNGCRLCSKITTEDFIKRAKSVHGELFDYSKSQYKSRKNKVIIICKKHGEFLSAPENHIDGRTGCPNCLVSKGELKISHFLNSLNILFYRNYKINECKNIHPLKFDFFLPQLNKAIEYDGQQHFSSKWLGEKNFQQIQFNDSLKNEFCNNNEIPLLRIKYDDKNYQDKIIKFLNGIR